MIKIPVCILQTRKSVRQWESQIGLFRQAVTTSSELCRAPERRLLHRIEVPPKMKWLQQLWPLDWFCVLTMAKDFTTHPVLGSPKLNARGLHVWRKLTAQRSCDDRRRRMKAALPAERELFAQWDAEGIMLQTEFLGAEHLAAVRAELYHGDFQMIEMLQPPTLTRRVNLDTETCRDHFPRYTGSSPTRACLPAFAMRPATVANPSSPSSASMVTVMEKPTQAATIHRPTGMSTPFTAQQRLGSSCTTWRSMKARSHMCAAPTSALPSALTGSGAKASRHRAMRIHCMPKGRSGSAMPNLSPWAAGRGSRWP